MVKGHNQGSVIDISVIIPTYNRVDLLKETLNSLHNQVFPKNKFEVIVVDDGSIDETEKLVRQENVLNKKYLRQSNQGSAIARNLGASESIGNLLIFIDDDILLDENYISALYHEHRCFPHIIGMGQFKPFLPQDPTRFNQIYSELMATKNVGQEGAYVHFTECVTNNLSVERDAFFEIGTMEDVAGDGPTWWGDVDFGYRAFLLGYQLRCCGKAICYHNDYSIRDLTTASDRAKKASRMAVMLFQKHSGLQHHLPMFEDKGPISWQRDAPRLVLRKMLRQLSSLILVLHGMEKGVIFLERYIPNHSFLKPLYRWILGVHIYKGYREGLAGFPIYESSG